MPFRQARAARATRAARAIAAALAIALLAPLLAACAGSPAATPTPTRTPAPAAGPTGPGPAATTPAPAVEPTAGATPTSGVMTSFPPDVNPLTGETVADPAVLERRPLAIKISNSPAQFVRPQAGVGQADLVFEHYAEGGVTRLTAVYLGRDAALVGPVRSGRLIDLEVPVMLQAMFAASGFSAGVKNLIRQSPLYGENRVISPDFGAGDPPFHRVPRGSVPFEHTLYTSTEWLWNETEARGLNGRQDLHGLAFSAEPPAGGAPVSTLRVNYAAPEAYVEWRYDPATAGWLRWQGGAAFTDAAGGAQVTAANVVVLYANHVTTDIQEDALGAWSIQIQLWGSGPARLYRDGQESQGFWLRQDPADLLGLTDAAGSLLPLKPGQTWFQVVTLDADTGVAEDTVTVTP
jgi:hypothetical protein